jgi:outer membrane lipoprotein-sorting protein
MRWLALPAVLCLAVPASAQDGDAEKLYRAMEKKVRGAKSLHIVVTGELDAQVAKGTLKGTVNTAAGNKVRLDMVAEFAGKTEKLLSITDGKMQYTKQGDVVKVDPNPRNVDQLDKMVPGLIGRVGMVAMFTLAEPIDPCKKPEPFDLDKECPVKNFKFGAKELVGTRPAQVVEYQIEEKGKTLKASVWIDTQTQLPLKRLLIGDDAGQTIRITETYNTFTVNGKLDPKLFDIPK